MDVTPFFDEDVPAAAALLADRHRRQRTRFALLPVRYEDAGAAAGLVTETRDFSAFVAAREGGRLVGFLSGFLSEPDPASPMARYALAKATTLLAHGQAIAGDVDPGDVVPRLFSALAGWALERDVRDHVAHVPLGDPHEEAAWVALGFGRLNLVSIRDLEPLGTRADVDVRRAGPDDLDVVQALVAVEEHFHAGAPIFRPLLVDQTSAAVRAELADQLDSDAHLHLLAEVGGVPKGVLAVGPPVGSPVCLPDRSCYVRDVAVLPEARGCGIGAALVEAGFTWARGQGYAAATLHFASANRTSARFWTGLGFEPVMAHLCRRIDPRTPTGRIDDDEATAA